MLDFIFALFKFIFSIVGLIAILFGVLYLFGDLKYVETKQVKYLDNMALEFTTPKEWCALPEILFTAAKVKPAANEVIIKRKGCGVKDFVKKPVPSEFISLKALRASEAENEVGLLRICTQPGGGMRHFADKDAIYCIVSTKESKMIISYRNMGRNYLAITSMTLDDEGDLDNQRQNLMSFVSSYKLLTR